MNELIEYDTSVLGAQCEKFIGKWIDIPDSVGWVAVNQRGTLVG